MLDVPPAVVTLTRISFTTCSAFRSNPVVVADTADALRYLKTRYKLVILSNVSRDGFAASNRKLGVEFDAIYTAEDIGAYKPSPANFHYLLERLDSDFGLQKDDILHTAQSLFHDHVPAKAFGLANAWIDRQRLSESGKWGATAEVAERPETDYLYCAYQVFDTDTSRLSWHGLPSGEIYVSVSMDGGLKSQRRGRHGGACLLLFL